MATCTFDKLAVLADEELVERSQGGDTACGELLVRRYRRLVRAKVGGYFLAGADADDIEQEGLIGLFKAVRDYRPDRLSPFPAFAEMCVTRQVITAIKAAARYKHQPLNRYVSLSAVRGSDNPGERVVEDLLWDHRVADPADAVVSDEAVRRLRRSMAGSLSALESEVLGLHMEGRSYQEISARLGRHVKAIDNALQRIKRKLEHLADEDFDRGLEVCPAA